MATETLIEVASGPSAPLEPRTPAARGILEIGLRCWETQQMVIEIMHYAEELPSDEEIRKCQARLPPHIRIELKLYKEWLA